MTLRNIQLELPRWGDSYRWYSVLLINEKVRKIVVDLNKIFLTIQSHGISGLPKLKCTNMSVLSNWNVGTVYIIKGYTVNNINIKLWTCFQQKVTFFFFLHMLHYENVISQHTSEYWRYFSSLIKIFALLSQV